MVYHQKEYLTSGHLIGLPLTHLPQTPASPSLGPCTHGPTHRRGVPDPLLKHHLSKHWRALQNGEVDASALAEHVQSIGHRVDLSKTEVTEPGQGNAA